MPPRRETDAQAVQPAACPASTEAKGDHRRKPLLDAELVPVPHRCVVPPGLGRCRRRVKILSRGSGFGKRPSGDRHASGALHSPVRVLLVVLHTAMSPPLGAASAATGPVCSPVSSLLAATRPPLGGVFAATGALVVYCLIPSVPTTTGCALQCHQSHCCSCGHMRSCPSS